MLGKMSFAVARLSANIYSASQQFAVGSSDEICIAGTSVPTDNKLVDARSMQLQTHSVTVSVLHERPFSDKFMEPVA
jgi:hypothetical protein